MKYANIKTFLPFFLFTLCSSISLHSTNNKSTPDAAIKNDARQRETKRTLKKKVVSFSEDESIIPWPIAWSVLPGNSSNN